MLFNKIKNKKFDLYSFVLILIIFGLDRFSKIYVIDLIQTYEKEIYIYDFLNSMVSTLLEMGVVEIKMVITG